MVGWRKGWSNAGCERSGTASRFVARLAELGVELGYESAKHEPTFLFSKLAKMTGTLINRTTLV